MLEKTKEFFKKYFKSNTVKASTIGALAVIISAMITLLGITHNNNISNENYKEDLKRQTYIELGGSKIDLLLTTKNLIINEIGNIERHFSKPC